MRKNKKNQAVHKQLGPLESALSRGYSIQGTAKDNIREVVIYPRMYAHNAPLVKVTSKTSIEEALIRAAKNYDRWAMGQEQINYDEAIDTSKRQAKIVPQSTLDLLITKGHILQLARIQNVVRCKINGFWVDKTPASKQADGVYIMEAIEKTLQKPTQK